MSKAPQTRVNPPVDRAARIRPGSAAAAFGALVGLAIGCAYLGGTAARATTVRAQAERILRDLDVVQREEFEAVKEMARLAREENEALKARIAAVEAKLDKPAKKGASAASE